MSTRHETAARRHTPKSKYTNYTNYTTSNHSTGYLLCCRCRNSAFCVGLFTFNLSFLLTVPTLLSKLNRSKPQLLPFPTNTRRPRRLPNPEERKKKKKQATCQNARTRPTTVLPLLLLPLKIKKSVDPARRKASKFPRFLRILYARVVLAQEPVRLTFPKYTTDSKIRAASGKVSSK